MILAEIEKHLNKLIALDEEALAELARLDGKIIQLNLLNTRACYYLAPGRHGVRVRLTCDGNVDVVISGTPTALISQVIRKSDAGTSPADIEIRGDVAVAQEFQRILREMDVDWEEGLSHWFGDGIAHHLGRFIRGAAGFLENSNAKLQEDVSEYLRFEKEVSIEKDEMESFSIGVDELRNDVERLKQRIARLEKN